MEPAYKAYSADLRQSLALLMGILPPDTIESYFGKEVGPEQKFIVALRSLVSGRIDLSAKQILESHRMQDSTKMDLNSLVKMIALTR